MQWMNSCMNELSKVMGTLWTSPLQELRSSMVPNFWWILTFKMDQFQKDTPTLFWVSERGPPLNHSFVPKNGGTTIWEKNPGNPSLLFQQGCPCVKVMVFCSHKDFKGQVPFRNFHSPCRFLEETQFSPWIGGQRAVNMEDLASNSFLPDEARRIWKPQTQGNKLPGRSFFSKVVALQRF